VCCACVSAAIGAGVRARSAKRDRGLARDTASAIAIRGGAGIGDGRCVPDVAPTTSGEGGLAGGGMADADVGAGRWGWRDSAGWSSRPARQSVVNLRARAVGARVPGRLVGQKERAARWRPFKVGGEGGIRTPVPVTRQDAFEAPPLRPLRYLSLFGARGYAARLSSLRYARTSLLAPLRSRGRPSSTVGALSAASARR
jgi:hypothetical protein